LKGSEEKLLNTPPSFVTTFLRRRPPKGRHRGEPRRAEEAPKKRMSGIVGLTTASRGSCAHSRKRFHSQFLENSDMRQEKYENSIVNIKVKKDSPFRLELSIQ
jgi:hypothetical protein